MFIKKMMIPILFFITKELHVVKAGVGTIWLFEHADYSGNVVTISLDGTEKLINSVSKPLLDEATAVRWQLDEGVAVRLLDLQTEFATRYETRGIDLYGSGEMNLNGVNLNDSVSYYYVWWSYNPKLGYVNVYKDKNWGNERLTIFLSDWTPGENIDFQKWSLQNDISSMDWSAICDVCTMSLYSEWGSGKQFEAYGWSDTKSVSNFGVLNLDDSFTSFTWSFREPKAWTFDPIQMKFDSVTGGTAYSNCAKGTNYFFESGQKTMTIFEETARSFSLSMESTYELGVTVSTEVTASVANVSCTVGVSVSASYSNTRGTATTTEDSFGLDLTTTVTTPSRAKWNSTFIATTGKTSGHGSANSYYWYDVPIANAVLDPTKNNWYKLTVPMNYNLDGDLHYRTETYSFIEKYLDAPAPKLCPDVFACTASRNKPGHYLYLETPTTSSTDTSICKSKCIDKRKEKLILKWGWKCGTCP